MKKKKVPNTLHDLAIIDEQDSFLFWVRGF